MTITDTMLAAVIQSSLDCVIVAGEDGIIREFNPAAEQSFGYRRDDAVGKPIRDLIIPPHLRAAHDEGWARYVASGEPHIMGTRVETEGLHADGHIFPVELTVTQAEAAGERLFAASLRDLSARRALEQQAGQTNSILATALQSSLDGVIVTDDEGHVVSFNASAESMFGYSRQEALGVLLRDLIVPPDRRDAHTAEMKRYKAGGASPLVGQRIRTMAMRKDAVPIPIELSTTEIRSGGTPFFVASIRDLTEVESLRREVQSQTALLEGFMEHAPVGLYVKDGESGRYVIANPEMEKTAGIRPEDLIGKTAADFFEEDEVAIIEAEDRRVIETGEVHRIVERMEGLEAEWSLIVRFPIEGPAGQTMVGGVEVDITPQKRAEEELQRSREALNQAERMTALGSLLAGISHELNNPLAIVVGEATLLEEDAQDSAFGDSARRIRKAAERCSRITQSFLAMARQKPAQKHRASLNAMVAETIELTHYGLRSSDILLETALDPQLPPIFVDVDQLQQVLANLLVNAQQALQDSKPPRRVRVESFADGEMACLRIADNGPGVPKDIAPRIFDPFFTTKPEGTGTGIGLSFCQGVVEAHGGSLRLEPGEQGASFLICLPGDDSLGEPVEDDAAPVSAARAKGRALVIDDEPELGDALGRLLKREGYEFDWVGDGLAARQAIEANDYALILSDLRMPKMDGPALHAWLCKARPELVARLGFVTGDALSPGAVTFLAESRRPHIAKPFTREHVRELIGQMTGSKLS